MVVRHVAPIKLAPTFPRSVFGFDPLRQQRPVGNGRGGEAGEEPQDDEGESWIECRLRVASATDAFLPTRPGETPLGVRERGAGANSSGAGGSGGGGLRNRLQEVEVSKVASWGSTLLLLLLMLFLMVLLLLYHEDAGRDGVKKVNCTNTAACDPRTNELAWLVLLGRRYCNLTVSTTNDATCWYIPRIGLKDAVTAMSVYAVKRVRRRRTISSSGVSSVETRVPYTEAENFRRGGYSYHTG